MKMIPTLTPTYLKDDIPLINASEAINGILKLQYEIIKTEENTENRTAIHGATMAYIEYLSSCDPRIEANILPSIINDL